MTATITSMDYTFADYLYPNQINEGDLLKFDGEFFTVIEINETDNGTQLILVDDFDDEHETFLLDDDKVEWYVLTE